VLGHPVCDPLAEDGALLVGCSEVDAAEDAGRRSLILLVLASPKRLSRPLAILSRCRGSLVGCGSAQ
jgi:hypothetical protein